MRRKIKLRSLVMTEQRPIYPSLPIPCLLMHQQAWYWQCSINGSWPIYPGIFQPLLQEVCVNCFTLHRVWSFNEIKLAQVCIQTSHITLPVVVCCWPGVPAASAACRGSNGADPTWLVGWSPPSLGRTRTGQPCRWRGRAGRRPMMRCPIPGLRQSPSVIVNLRHLEWEITSKLVL